MSTKFISIFQKGFAFIGLFAFLGLDVSCNNQADKQTDSNADVSLVITEKVKIIDSPASIKTDSGVPNMEIGKKLQKTKNADHKTDTLPQVKKSKTPVPVNPREILNVELNVPVNLSNQLIKLNVDNKIRQQVKAMDLARRTTILEVTVSYTSPPKNNYIVYVDTDKTASNKLAGFLNFYGAKEMMQIPGKYGSQVFLFDIKEEYDLKNMDDTLKLLIVNDSGKAETEITIIKVRLDTVAY